MCQNKRVSFRSFFVRLVMLKMDKKNAAPIGAAFFPASEKP